MYDRQLHTRSFRDNALHHRSAAMGNRDIRAMAGNEQQDIGLRNVSQSHTLPYSHKLGCTRALDSLGTRKRGKSRDYCRPWPFARTIDLLGTIYMNLRVAGRLGSLLGVKQCTIQEQKSW
jgi:hypothetical protein